MDAPTAAQVQEWTNLSELKNAEATAASRVVARAAAVFRRITGLTYAAVAAEDEPLVQHAVQGLAESMWFDQSEEILETLSDFALLSSFSAGPYSETRRSPEEAFKARLLHPWPWLNSLLWLLLTDEMRDHWEDLFGGSSPAFAVQEVDWSGELEGGELGTAPGGMDPWWG